MKDMLAPKLSMGHTSYAVANRYAPSCLTHVENILQGGTTGDGIEKKFELINWEK